MKTKRRLAKRILLAFAIALIASIIAVAVVAARPGGYSGVIDFKQLTTDPPTETKRWIGGILGFQNAYYYEGMTVNQRVLFADIEPTMGNVHALTFKHQATKGDIHAYDWLTGWDQGNDDVWPHGSWYNYERCGERIGPPKDLGAICQSLDTGPYDFLVPVPDDTFMSKDGPTLDRILAYEALPGVGNREIRICGNLPIDNAWFEPIYHARSGVIIDPGDDYGDTYVHYELKWVSASDQILIQMAGHLSVSGDPSVNPIAWGPAMGSSQIKGGPYHFKLDELDELDLGSRDNQIKGADILILPGKKGGYKWNDLNGDGIWDDGEPAIGGWTIYLKDDTGTVIATAETDEEGFYLFKGLELGDYTVEEELPDGWTCTCPGPSRKYDFTVTSGFEDLDNNFGNFENVEITACKFEDFDGDGDADEPIKGWTVHLTIDGEIVDTKLTGENGCYTWTDLGPLPEGSYYDVSESVPPGWTATSPTSYILGRPVSGETYRRVFTNFENVDVKARKLEDLDGDLATTDDQTPVPNWMIYLSIDGVRQLPGKETGADGWAEWTDLGPGHSYNVEEDVPDGWTALTPTSHDFGPAKSGQSYSFIFVNFELGKKGGYKWDDLNGDGIWDDGEPGMGGWTIYLKDDTGAVIATTTTDPDGKYLFDDLEAGDYTVEEEYRAGWTCTCPGIPAKYEFTVKSGFVDLDNNFGNYFPSWISDTTRCRYPYEYFDIVFTPSGEGLYKISSTNPGEFYFNMLYHSWTSDPQTINYNLADGAFVTVGSMPIHAYEWNDSNGDGNIRTLEGCLDWTELTDITHKITTAQDPDLSSGPITISDVEPCTHILITIHINFDLKKTDAYSDPTAFEGTVYTFTANGRVATLTVENAKFPDE